MIIVSIIERICHGKEYLRDDVVSKVIEDLNGIYILGGFNQNQIRYIFLGIWVWDNEWYLWV